MNKQINFRCGCGQELLNIEIDYTFSESYPDVYVSMFRKWYGSSLFTRIKQILKILKTGNPYEDEMILSLEDLINLNDFIDSLDIEKLNK